MCDYYDPLLKQEDEDRIRILFSCLFPPQNTESSPPIYKKVYDSDDETKLLWMLFVQSISDDQLFVYGNFDLRIPWLADQILLNAPKNQRILFKQSVSYLINIFYCYLILYPIQKFPKTKRSPPLILKSKDEALIYINQFFLQYTIENNEGCIQMNVQKINKSSKATIQNYIPHELCH